MAIVLCDVASYSHILHFRICTGWRFTSRMLIIIMYSIKIIAVIISFFVIHTKITLLVILWVHSHQTAVIWNCCFWELGASWLDKVQWEQVSATEGRNKIPPLLIKFVSAKGREPPRHLAELTKHIFRCSQCSVFSLLENSESTKPKFFIEEHWFQMHIFWGPGCSFYVLVFIWEAIQKVVNRWKISRVPVSMIMVRKSQGFPLVLKQGSSSSWYQSQFRSSELNTISSQIA